MATKRNSRQSMSIEERHKVICEMVAEGKTVRQIAAHFNTSSGRILAWATENQEFTEQYARAREAAADMFETEIIEAALSVTSNTAAADRVKIDAMKWVAARRAPKKYGDRQSLDIVSTNTNTNIEMTREEFKDEARSILNEV